MTGRIPIINLARKSEKKKPIFFYSWKFISHCGSAAIDRLEKSGVTPLREPANLYYTDCKRSGTHLSPPAGLAKDNIFAMGLLTCDGSRAGCFLLQAFQLLPVAPEKEGRKEDSTCQVPSQQAGQTPPLHIECKEIREG